MHNTETDFYGKQTDEKILYVVRPHPLATIFSLIKICSIAIMVSLALIVIGKQIESISGLFVTMGIILFLLIIVIGIKIVLDWESREVAYITDRRLVRFEPTTLFATNSRTLSWDEVVKVKTYPNNFIFKQMAIGNVVVHARTSIRTAEDTPIDTVTADDIEIKDVYFYRDLGNYIDKILFTYKQKPSEIDSIKPFVLKPKGERY